MIMKTRALAAAAVLLFSLPMVAEVKSGVEHSGVSCVRGGELPLLQVAVEGKGELRGYFRRINTTDWCSVEGVNDGPLSRVVLPKFEPGDEIEYFFVLIDGVRVTARSQRIYRTRVTAECETAWARHILRLTMNCGEDVQAVPDSLGAGYMVDDRLVKGNPPVTSPDSPTQGSNQ